MKTPLPKFPHHRGVPKHHFGVKTPLLATLDNYVKVSIFELLTGAPPRDMLNDRKIVPSEYHA